MIWPRRHILYISFDAERLTIRSSQRAEVYSDLPYLAVEGAKRIVAVGASAQQAIATDPQRYRLVAPFSHPRLWISNYSAAEALIRYGLATLTLPYPRLRPHIIVHPRRLTLHDLTHLELVIGYDLALNLQSKQAYIWLGRELTQQEYSTLRFPTGDGRAFQYPVLTDALDTTI
jgi:rod shape-determining protein MreB